jgi:hypothetical protein
MTQAEIESEVARFKPQHKLYIDQNDDNTPLYRVFPLDSLLEVLIENKLTLVKTKFWEDPYENYIFKCNWAMQDGTRIDPTGMIDHFFGQCWTITEESDAMWRIYSPDTKSVRVKTSLNKLFDVIFDDHTYNSLTKSFIGRVQYDTKTNIQNHISNSNNPHPIITDTSAQIMIDAHLWKRNEFKHEKEVRILHTCDSHSPLVKQQVVKFDINPNDLFEEITFDPRINGRFEAIYTETIRRMGYTGAMNKSELYKLDPVNITI